MPRRSARKPEMRQQNPWLVPFGHVCDRRELTTSLLVRVPIVTQDQARPAKVGPGHVQVRHLVAHFRCISDTHGGML